MIGNSDLTEPGLVCRIVQVVPLGDQLDAVAKPSPGMAIEEAVVELDNGLQLPVFVPGLYVEPDHVGPRCVIRLEAILGDRFLQQPSEVSWEQPTEWDKQAFTGEVLSFWGDGVVLRTEGGTLAVTELFDDRFEAGAFMRVANFRLDLDEVVAVEGHKGSWETVRLDPYPDINEALGEFRAGKIEIQRLPSMEINSEGQVTGAGEAVRKVFRAHDLSGFVYRLGEMQATQAEMDIVALLGDEDRNVSFAAVWVLCRYWHLTQYLHQVADIAFSSRPSVAAIVGTGILTRGTHDGSVSRRLIRLIRNSKNHWFLREAAYLALLGVWLPETTERRRQWRPWNPWHDGKDKRFKTWDKWAIHHVDWDLITRIERA